jgi:hypothetical protein
MKKPAILTATILASFLFIFATSKHSSKVNATPTIIASPNATASDAMAMESDEAAVAESSAMYTEMNLGSMGMKQDVFSTAIKGLKKLVSKGSVTNDDVITIADFSQPSSQKRLYVVDLKNKKVLFNTLVAHGKNTGTLMATSFSNSPSSLKSSPGFFVTEGTYNGDNGYSLRLNGLERNINDNALSRAVVMHGAPYVNESFAHSMGFIGRSWGCPALPTNQTKAIINTIRDGSCLFIYTTANNYLQRSTVLNS